MGTRRFFTTVGCVLIALFIPVSSWATIPGEVGFVKQAYQVLSQLDRQRTNRNEVLVTKALGYFDLDHLFHTITQDFADKLSEQDYQGLLGNFKKVFMVQVYRKGLKLSDRRLEDIEYLLKKRGAPYTWVELRGRVEQKKLEILFTLLPKSAGKSNAWSIVDLSVNGALLSRNYRGQFNRIHRVEGVAGLNKRMQIKFTELTKH